MKMIGSYIKTRLNIILLILFLFIIYFVIHFLYSENMDPVLYTVELEVTILLILAVVDFRKYSRKYHLMESALKEENLYQIEFEKTHNNMEELYQELIEKLIDTKYQLTEKDSKKMAELKDYYAVWAHQIKTPISAMDLLLQVSKKDNIVLQPEDIKELKNQLFQIDFYVDAVMNYLRLEDMSSDFKFTQTTVEPIIRKTIKKFAPQFIGKKLSVELNHLDIEVFTDEKWLGFILEQLISNAVKYTDAGGQIKIYSMDTLNVNDRIIVIEDNGIGIAKEDIPRIFERGYTGYNGRMNQKSSGIGLYLCKMAADKLGNTITIESETGVGTKVILNLTKYLTQHE